MDAMGFRGIIWSSQPLCHKLLLRHRVWRSSRTQGGMRWGKMNSNSRHFETGRFDWRPELRAFGIPQILVGALVAAMVGPIAFTAVHAENQIAIAPHPEASAAAVIGGVGEIGLMQIRPETAAMLGFRGSAEDLAKPETNIHYGVTYLSKAWRLANGDLCRTLMKYRAGHGEEVMTKRSVNYCNRARNHLAGLGSPLATGTTPPAIIPASVLANISPKLVLNSPKDVYAQYKQGTPAASRAFWAAHEARVRAITARIEARWHRVASR